MLSHQINQTAVHRSSSAVNADSQLRRILVRRMLALFPNKHLDVFHLTYLSLHECHCQHGITSRISRASRGCRAASYDELHHGVDRARGCNNPVYHLATNPHGFKVRYSPYESVACTKSFAYLDPVINPCTTKTHTQDMPSALQCRSIGFAASKEYQQLAAVCRAC
jgi:hypothetical protein